MAKGGLFEREVSRKLTAWWTGDPNADVVFWRTAGSGGRATSRRRTGKSTTAAHCGDIGALTDDAAILTRLVTIECKNGYQSETIHDLLDGRGSAVNARGYGKWIGQAVKSTAAAGSRYWVIIHHRKGLDTTITMPWYLFHALDGKHRQVDGPLLRVEIENVWAADGGTLQLATCGFDAFLAGVTPIRVRHLSMAVNPAK